MKPDRILPMPEHVVCSACGSPLIIRVHVEEYNSPTLRVVCLQSGCQNESNNNYNTHVIFWAQNR